MKYPLTPALAAFALTACGSSSVDADADGDGNVTADEMKEAAAAVGGDLKPEPGKYATKMELTEVDMPGAPQQFKDIMAASMSQTMEYCLTPEMAEKGWEESIKEGQNGECDVNSFTMGGGKVDMTMTCAVEEGGGAMKLALTGDVTSTSSDMTMTMDGTIPELGPVKMTMDFEQERIGNCD